MQAKPLRRTSQKIEDTIMPTPESRDPRIRSQSELPTRNFFASEMEVKCTLVEETTDKLKEKTQQPSSRKSGRPPPILLTSTTNLMQLQRHMKGILTVNFEFRNNRSGTRIVTKEMADFQP
jgi:hypothetical protein